MDLRGILNLFERDSFIKSAVMRLFETACDVLERIPESGLRSQFRKGHDVIWITNTKIIYTDYGDEEERDKFDSPDGIALEQILPYVEAVRFNIREKKFALFWDEDSFEKNGLAKEIADYFDGEVDNAECGVIIPLSKLMEDLDNP